MQTLPQATPALADKEGMGPLITPIHAEAVQAGDARGVPAAIVGIDPVVRAEVRIPNSSARTHDDGGTGGHHIHVICRSEGSKLGESGDGWEAHLGLRRAEYLAGQQCSLACQRDHLLTLLTLSLARTLVICFVGCFFATK